MNITAHAVNKGWVSLDYIQTTTAKVTMDVANVRKYAKKDSNLLSTVKKGTTVKLYYVTKNWYYTDKGGFIYYKAFE